ncbi:MAG: hypothetical protein A2525_05300 [Sulfurimonas sp. RIFOXYD12_FULL_36_11]|nr:MAG: hypothetical protein A2525_05300 [Sulfurimonas sp. RIFOXYD12_FULL_36_11]
MLIQTNNIILDEYKRNSDKSIDVKNFRLYYNEKPTNLIWYDGKIIFIPKEYFLLKNLANLHAIGKHKCSIFASDVALIDELKEKNINFILDNNLNELLSRLEMVGRFVLSNEVSVELISDKDYSKINEPIYLGGGVWLNM